MNRRFQVYIRIRDEEWNVYHRYSSFYLLYNKMKKEFPEVRQFDFPPKKTLNKKVMMTYYQYVNAWITRSVLQNCDELE